MSIQLRWIILNFIRIQKLMSNCELWERSLKTPWIKWKNESNREYVNETCTLRLLYRSRSTETAAWKWKNNGKELRKYNIFVRHKKNNIKNCDYEYSWNSSSYAYRRGHQATAKFQDKKARATRISWLMKLDLLGT